ncbi:MAG TPA: alkaline phosphatase family protein [Anaerolineae bacterium]|nr:alkaline phosphatase family protein [Anaerolineae bacterium]HOQ98516.1 alkaline phosphatase family protein [Anaerolineae bacterium]HOQ98529.1 alkaline phosphatase family protein [Anaerolineae bacterium]HPL27186.1 alkaline phosphatase family protein [Anaerolineae bacterium]
MQSGCLPEHLLRSPELLERYLIEQRSPALATLGLPDDFVVPCHGVSIANLPATLAEILGAKLTGAAGPLPDAMWMGLADGVQRVVWLILDAAGWLDLCALLQEEPELSLARLARDGRCLPITSVFPSTTSSALTTLWTGYGPAQHGLVGHILYLREFGTVVDMLIFSPMGVRQRDEMIGRGLVPEEFAPVPGLAEALVGQGVTTRTLINLDLAMTGFSRISYRGVAEVGRFVTAADMCVRLRHMLSAHSNERLLLVGYMHEVDNIGHVDGPGGDAWRAGVRSLAFSLEREFLNGLTPEERRGTMLVLTSDHGQLPQPGASIYTTDHQELRSHLLLPATGGMRAAYLYARQGYVDAVEAYAREHLAEQFVPIRAGAALETGLLGSGRLAPEAASRLGDVLLIARDHYVLDHRKREHPPMGMHGGLTRWEMLSPLLMARLD